MKQHIWDFLAAVILLPVFVAMILLVFVTATVVVLLAAPANLYYTIRGRRMLRKVIASAKKHEK